MRLKGKVAVITGGANGIGRAIAERFISEGAITIICDIRREELDAAVAGMKGPGEALAFVTDVTNEEQVAETVREIAAKFGRIDILVNNAGITSDAQLVKMTAGQFDNVINVNLKGVFLMTRAVAPHMIAAGGGRIVNAASVVGLFGNFGQTNYAAAKAGLIAMTKTWAKELGKKNICVNAVAPGFIATDMVKKMPEDILAAMCAKTPLKRLGTPGEIANVYLFLASDEASYINGATISVDGGIAL